ncbi:MAG: SMI1/KNR4 family protein [Fuerstiella sp.]|jgi:hypothetical protein|nr:SMI1/KNR4 family protein [Fuerstiella sp.]
MITDTKERLEERFTESPVLRASTTPSDTEINEAAQALGVSFDSDYREFVKLYGGAMVGPYPIFGLRPVEVMDDELWSVVTVTARYRETGIADVVGWYVVSEDHAGNPVGIDAEGKVWTYDHDFGGPAIIASSFEEYLRSKCLSLRD